MRGTDYFPPGRWADLFDEVRRTHENIRRNEGRNYAAQPWTRDEYHRIFVRVNGEKEQENRRAMEMARLEEAINGDPRYAHLWEGVPELDVPALPEKVFERPRLAPFKLKYDTLEEVRMRFRQTCILIKGNPFYVNDMRHRDGVFTLLVEDGGDRKSTVRLDEIPDLRGAPPGYVIDPDNGPVYMLRMAARVNQQGMNPQNTQMRKIGANNAVPFGVKNIVKAIESKGKTTKWNPAFLSLIEDRAISELRLSDDVAIFTKPKVKKIYVGYKGRVFGSLENGNVAKADDADDLLQPWVKKHFDRVELEVRK